MADLTLAKAAAKALLRCWWEDVYCESGI